MRMRYGLSLTGLSFGDSGMGGARNAVRHQLATRVAKADSRRFSVFRPLYAVRPYILADIGEGITECQIIRWLVKPGDRVQEFDPICEVQSDKASVEVTSRYDGVVRALHYEQDDMAAVGKALLDLDVEDEDQAMGKQADSSIEASQRSSSDTIPGEATFRGTGASSEGNPVSVPAGGHESRQSSSSDAAQITPGVRHLLKKHGLDGGDIAGTGRGGRITKDDVQEFLLSKKRAGLDDQTDQAQTAPDAPSMVAATPPQISEDTTIQLSPVEKKMFQSMTHALTIPHFMYNHEVDVTSLEHLRTRVETSEKLSPLPFVLKAISQAFLQQPRMNAHLDTATENAEPQFIMRSSHNFGIAVDSPSGLVVPVIRDVQDHSVVSLAREIKRLSSVAREGRLSPNDFKGATFTISNIGSIGGSVVAPIIVPPMVGIVAIGRTKQVPVCWKDEDGVESIAKRYRLGLSWSADHRVLDGAKVARIAEHVAILLEKVEVWSSRLR